MGVMAMKDESLFIQPATAQLLYQGPEVKRRLHVTRATHDITG